MPLYKVDINKTTFGSSQEAIITRNQIRSILQESVYKLTSNYEYKQQKKGNHGVYVFG